MFGRAALAALVIATGACGAGEGVTEAPPLSRAGQVVMHASPDCSCCGGWAEHMRAEGYDVRRVDEPDMGAVKRRYGVPAEASSCHTAVVDGYVVEGHVPAVAVDRLLDIRPAIDGIAVFGMPAGSPGMGGVAEGPLEVLSIIDGAVAGTFGRY